MLGCGLIRVGPRPRRTEAKTRTTLTKIFFRPTRRVCRPMHYTYFSISSGTTTSWRKLHKSSPDYFIAATWQNNFPSPTNPKRRKFRICHPDTSQLTFVNDTTIVHAREESFRVCPTPFWMSKLLSHLRWQWSAEKKTTLHWCFAQKGKKAAQSAPFNTWPLKITDDLGSFRIPPQVAGAIRLCQVNC